MRIIALLTAVLWLAACENAVSSKEVYMPPEGERMMATSKTAQAEPAPEVKILKEARVRFETENPDQTAREIKELIRRYEGILINEDKHLNKIGKKEKEIIYRMEAKIPAENLDAFLTALDEIAGNYDYKNIRAQDVTERYIDLEARLKAKKDLYAKFSRLLEQARTLDETIRLEKELARLQAEIERLEGQLKYLNDRTAYSRVHMEFYKKILTGPRFFAQLKTAFVNGWILFQEFLIALAGLWIFILLGILIWFVWRKKRA